MTTVSMRDTLLEAARDVFETMAFMALEETQEEITWGTEDSLLGSITFKGNLEGCLCVCCAIPCAQAIAANMLGMDSPEGLGQTDVQDAIGEIANMVLGSLKSRVQEQVGTLDVSIPSVIQGRRLRSGIGEGTSEIVINVSVEGQYPAVFSLLYRQTAV
jgi:chemotaxis protein CheX